MEKILVSACLLGYRVRYDASDKLLESDILKQWQQEGCLVPFCPELAPGGTVPRPPAEIIGDGGQAVLEGHARVIDNTGRNLTRLFISAAEMTLEKIKKHQIRLAILSDGSPSCGTTFIHDGTFSGSTKSGQGVIAAFLAKNGVAIFGEDQITSAFHFFQTLQHGE